MQGAIGIFDSGLGGLTVAKAIRRLMPEESLVYLGDTARVPYGNKSKEAILRYSLENSRFLLERGIKALVVACNTSSAVAVEALRREFPQFPVIDVIAPGVAAALQGTRNRQIGVIGTQATIRSEAYTQQLQKADPQVKVMSMACPLFVPLVEEGILEGEIADRIARHYLAPLAAAPVDTLILGCTHYPLLKPVIQMIMTDRVALIDSGEAAARHLHATLAERRELATRKTAPDQYYATDLPAKFDTVARRFMGEDLPAVKRVEL